MTYSHSNRTVRSWRIAGGTFRGTIVAVAVMALVASGGSIAQAGRPAGPTEPATVVLEWNAIALETLGDDPTTVGPQLLLYLGFVHAAVYDSVIGVTGGYTPYRHQRPAPKGTSATAASAAAAHRILATYVPAARSDLKLALAKSLSDVVDGPGKTQGVAYGEQVARELIALRADDGRGANLTFNTPPGPGVWRPTPTAFAPMSAPWLGAVTPLLVRSASQFAPPPPPGLTSARYARDFAEVKSLGSASSTTRTGEQEDVANFFKGNAVVQLNEALRDQAATRGLDIRDAARMFAAVYMTVADALITAWRAKLFYGVWRPSTAIQLADTDRNPRTDPDPTWTPLFTNPPYPDYISGYNVVIASATGALEGLFGRRDLNLNLISTAVPGKFRHYHSGKALRADVVNARVWLGIHFRFADVAARDVGVRLAGWTLEHYFRPVANHHR